MATDNEHLSLFVLRYLARGFNILLLFQNIFQIKPIPDAYYQSIEICIRFIIFEILWAKGHYEFTLECGLLKSA